MQPFSPIEQLLLFIAALTLCAVTAKALYFFINKITKK